MKYYFLKDAKESKLSMQHILKTINDGLNGYKDGKKYGE